jgi:hypothetical protein
MSLLLATIACVVASSGCGPTEPAPAPTVPVSQFAVSYERSGGLKVMPQKVVIRPGRHAVATTRNGVGVKTVRYRVPVRTVKQLRNGLSDPRFAAFEGGAPSTCADCYVYTIAFRGHTVTVDQSTVPVWLQKTITRLEALAGPHLPFH